MRVFFSTIGLLGILAACGGTGNTTTGRGSGVASIESVDERSASVTSARPVSETPVFAATPSSVRSMGDKAVTSAAEGSLVDPTIPPAVAGQAEWQFQREATADFDGDGVAERAVLIAKVQLSDGRPVWDDNQPWLVYIEEADTARTYIYSRNVQLGNVETLLTLADPSQAVAIVIAERTPQNLAMYEIQYRGPNDTEATEVLQRHLDAADGFAGTPY